MIKKKRAVWITVTALATTIATVVPIAVIYGTRQPDDEQETVDLTGGGNGLSLAWGQEPQDIPAPPLPIGRNAADYEPGKFYETNYTQNSAQIGQTGLFVSFQYDPIAGASVKKLNVKYKLEVNKAYTPPLNVTEQVEIFYNDPIPPFDFSAWLLNNKYLGYVQGAYKLVVYTNERNEVVDESQLATAVAANSKFTATYTADLDKEHYLDNGQPKGTYKIVYSVKRKKLEEQKSEGEQLRVKYGENFVLPTPPAPKEHFAFKSNEPQTEVTTQPNGATFTPAVGKQIFIPDVKKYESATAFKLVYTYRPADDYEGKEYTYTYSYVIDKQNATKGITAPLEGKQVQYGRFTSYTYPPAPNGGTGYYNSAVSTKVTKQSSIPGPFSPAKDADIQWAQINQYNAGTEFDVTYTYAPAAHYDGPTYTATAHYVIVKQKVAVHADSTAGEQGNEYGTDPASVTTPTFADSDKYEQPVVKYYDSPAATASQLSVDQVKKLNAETYFYARYTFSLKNDNYEPADPKVGSFVISVPVKVAKSSASYTGAKAYTGQQAAYGSAAPSDFVPNALPQPDQAVGYKFKSASYRVSSPAGDGSIGVGSLTDLSKVNTYGAGTVITATFTFEQDQNHAGPDVQVTKTLTIIPAVGTQPTPAQITVPRETRTYGQQQAEPTAPKTFTGFKTGAYAGASVTTAAFNGSPAVGPADWNKFNTYGAGTVVTATFHYEPNGNYSGLTAFDLTVDYVINKKPTAAPTNPSATPVNYEYGVEQSQPIAPTIVAEGYEGAYTSAKITKGPSTGTAVTWSQTDTYPAGTEFEVTYTYKTNDNYAGNEFTVIQKYVVTKRKVKIPADVPAGTNAVRYDRGADPLQINQPSPADASLFEVRGNPVFVDDKQASLTADQVKLLAENATFSSVWTIGLKDPANYAPETGTVDTYKITVKHQVYLSDISYTGNKTYSPAEVVYGNKPSNFVPATPPDPAVTGYVFKSVAYTITTEPADGSVKQGSIADLSKVDTYGAGTVITAKITFEPDANHKGGAIDFTKTLKVIPAKGTQPTAAQTTFSPKVSKYGTAQAKPAAPATFTGFKEGTYERATVTTPATNGFPSAQTTVDWTKFNTYGAGTVIRVVYAYQPNGNYDGLTAFEVTVEYRIDKADAIQPTNKVLTGQNFEYGTKPAKPTAPASQGTGYVGSFLSAKIVTTTSGGPAVGDDVDWNKVDTYGAGTTFTVTFNYVTTPDYQGNPFSMTMNYVVIKRKVAIPQAVVEQASETYYKNTDPASLTAPAAQDANLYQLAGTPVYVDANNNPLTVDQVKQLADGTKFSKRWTFALKDLNNYEPQTGTATTYTHTLNYVVGLANASYTGTSKYPAATVVYLQQPADFVPDQLPEPTKGVGYKFKGVTYAVTTAPADGSVGAGAIADLSKVNTYGAGTVVTATITFIPDEDHAGNEVKLTKTLTVLPAAGTQPTDAQKTFPVKEVVYGTPTSQPAAPTQYTGFKSGEYVKAEVIVAAPSNSPAAGDPVNWAQFNTYSAGTQIAVTYRYEPNGNYSGLTAFQVVVTYKINQKPAVRADGNAFADATYQFGNKQNEPAVPTNGEGYVGSLTSAKITKGVSGGPASNTDVVWNKTDTYPAGTEFTVTFTYNTNANYIGNGFSVTKKYAVTKRLVDIPADQTVQQETFSQNTDPAAITAPTIADSRFSVRGAPTYFNEQGAPINAPTVKNLVAGNKFTVKWTVGLKDTANYAPSSGTTDSYVISVPYVVILTPAYYTGKKVYDPITAVYGTTPTAPSFNSLPEPEKGSGYVYKGETYAITTAPADGSVAAGPIADLSKINTYGAGTVITITVTYTHDKDHSGTDITLTKTVTITQAVGVQPTAAETATTTVTKVYGQAQEKPVAPKTFAHFKQGAYVSATVTAFATDGSTTAATTVDWAKFATYGAGTEITVVFHYDPSPNFSGITAFDLAVKYVIDKAPAVQPSSLSLTKQTYQFADKQAQPSVPANVGTGYVGSFGSALLTNGPDAGKSVDWNSTDKYVAGTKFTVTFAYKVDANHAGNDFTLTQEYEVVKRKVTIPADVVNPAQLVYFIHADPAAITSPTVTDSLFELKGAPAYFADNGTALTADQVKKLGEKTKFTVRWTVGLKDSSNYESDQAARSVYYITNTYVVTLIPAKYDSQKYEYDPENVTYGSTIANFAPTGLPEQNKNTGYVFQKVEYKITTPSADGSIVTGSIPDLTKANTYGAGTEITAYVTFVTADGYSGTEIVATKVWSIRQAPGTQPTGAQLTVAPVEKTYGDAQTVPTNAPRQFTGFKNGTYVSAQITTAAADGSNVVGTADWTRFAAYGAGTVITVTYHYEPNGNYSGVVAFDLQATYVIKPKAAVQPTDKVLSPQNYEYGTQVNEPVAPVQGTGYTGTYASVRFTKSVAGTPGTFDWSSTRTYPAGTEFEVTFTYTKAPNYEGQPFTMTRKYVVVKRKVVIPADPAVPAEAVYYIKSNPSFITAPIVSDPLFGLRGTVTYADENNAPLTAAQVQALTKDRKFFAKWTVGLKETANYEQQTGTRDYYVIVKKYVVTLLPAAYTGKMAYDPALSDYGQNAPAGFVPNELPEPAKATGYVFKGATYAVSTAPADKSVAAGPINNLAAVNGYGAGTVITATFTFGPAPDYDGSELRITRTLTINKAKGVQPTGAAIAPVQISAIYKDTVSKPDNEPKGFVGFNKGTYVSAVIETRATDGSNKKGDPVTDWTKFSTYGAGTVIKVTYRYEPNVNYTGLTAFNLEVNYVIAPKPANPPTNFNLPPETYKRGTILAEPTPPKNVGEGFDDGTLASAIISNNAPGGEPSGTKADFKKTDKYVVGTEITVTFTYKVKANYAGDEINLIKKYTVVA